MKHLSFPKKRMHETVHSAREWMGAKLLPWYRRLSLREQRLTLSAAVILPVAGLIFGLWLPVRDEVVAIRQTLPKLEAQWREANMLATQLQQHGRKSAIRRDLLGTVNQAAQASNVRRHITRIKPQPSLGKKQRLLVLMHEVPYPNLIRFLAQLAKDGVALGRAKLLRGQKPGVVDVDLMVVSE